MYTRNQVREILKTIGVRIYSETDSVFSCFCPFHHNNSSPSFVVSKAEGLFLCFNAACDERGTLQDMIVRIADMNEFQAMRLIMQHQEEAKDFEEELAGLFEEEPEFEPFQESIMYKCHDSLMKNEKAKEYLKSRNITEESMEHFWLGYSEVQDMVVVPVHSPTGLLVGLVGRSIEGKRFKNSTHLPRSKTLFNLHRAKRHSGTLIITESTFDAIRLHQVGYPNAIASLGGNISKENFVNLNRYSTSLILATDADDAGIKLGQSITSTVKKSIQWARYNDDEIYPHGAKDIGDLTDAEIKHVIKNAVDNFVLQMI